MKFITKLLISTLLATNSFAQVNENLYPFIEDDLWGFIDKTGNVIIKPKFITVGRFSDGLAAARIKGYYGYIDYTGEFVITPEYDLANSFHDGLARVFVDGKPFFIDKKGKILFDHNYKSISDFGFNTYAIVITESDKSGIINRSGELIVDTIFERIGSFNDGVAVVTGLNHNPYSNKDNKIIRHEKGVIDTLGNWIVKYGEFKNISDFVNGYAKAELITDEEEYDQAVIDKTGMIKFIVPSDKWHFDYGGENFFEDIALVRIYSGDPDTDLSSRNFNLRGAINSKGEIICSNPDWMELTPFSLNRAFIKDKGGNWFLINTAGNKVSSQSFSKILLNRNGFKAETLFQNGIAFVETEKGWGAIDTTGKFIIQPISLDDLEYDYLIRYGDIIFLSEDISIESENYSYKYGFWNTRNNIIVEPQFHDIEVEDFDKDLIYVMQDGQIGYINDTGKQIWKSNNVSNKKLNIDYMNRGYYYASSKYKEELKGFGGWGRSDNNSKKINKNFTLEPGILQIFIDTNNRTKWADKYDAVKLFVVNKSKNTVYFSAQDSRLYLKLQAQDKNGTWRDIEYLPSSWCGNSYHTLFLDPNEYWEFSTPFYHGELKTKIRAELKYKKSKNDEESVVIFSNVIDGYVNPGQFWNKRQYYPSGLMDPYFD